MILSGRHGQFAADPDAVGHRTTAANWREQGIAAVHDLPGVGKNLQDHVDCVMVYECTKPVTLYSDLRADRLAWSVVEGMLFGRGVSTTFPYEAGAFLRSRPDLVAPDVQSHFMPALEKTANLHLPKLFGAKEAVELNHGFTLRVGPINPESRGEIRLRSASPPDPPRIQANYLQSEFDRRTIMTGIRMVREVFAQPAFAGLPGQGAGAGARRRQRRRR